MGGIMSKFVIAAGILFSALIFMPGNVSAQGQNDKKDKTVIIKKGDTLDKIAKANKTTYPRLFDANASIKHPDLIYAGKKIRIPDPAEKLARRTVAVTGTAQTATYSKTKTSQSVRSYSSSTNSTRSSDVSGGVWDRLAACESGGNWSTNTGNGYSGGLQFSQSTWKAVGGSGSPHNASKAEQIKRGKILQQQSGWGQWPACSAKLGLG
jgi:LysM repeat protein